MVVLRACQYVCDVERRVKVSYAFINTAGDCDDEKLILTSICSMEFQRALLGIRSADTTIPMSRQRFLAVETNFIKKS